MTRSRDSDARLRLEALMGVGRALTETDHYRQAVRTTATAGAARWTTAARRALDHLS